MQHVPAADRVAGDHRDHGLGQSPDLDLEVEHVQATDPVLVDVAVVAADALVPAGGEGERPLAGQDRRRRSRDRHGRGRTPSISSLVVSGRNALRTSGRAIVIFAIPSAVSYRMSEKSFPWIPAEGRSGRRANPGPVADLTRLIHVTDDS